MEALSRVVIHQVPGDQGRDFHYENLLREQTIGEIRGLSNIGAYIDNEIQELREKTKEQS